MTDLDVPTLRKIAIDSGVIYRMASTGHNVDVVVYAGNLPPLSPESFTGEGVDPAFEYQRIDFDLAGRSYGEHRYAALMARGKVVAGPVHFPDREAGLAALDANLRALAA